MSMYQCPGCESENFSPTEHRTARKRIRAYKCNDCGRSFIEPRRISHKHHAGGFPRDGNPVAISALRQYENDGAAVSVDTFMRWTSLGRWPAED